MSPSKLFRTSSFRLTLLYAGLFSASVLVLFAVIYWATALYMTKQLDDAFGSDIAELVEEWRIGGADGLVQIIQSRIAQMPNGPILYLLEDSSGKVLAGNLPQSPLKTGTFELSGQRRAATDASPIPIRARGSILPDGRYLLVGADAYSLHEMQRFILRAFGWSFAITLLLAFGTGALMSGSVLRRVDTISRTTREITEGFLSRRIPIRGVDDEFDHLAASLNAMLDRTERSIEGMRQVSTDIAHDLRTPLTRLRQRLELTQRKAGSIEELRAAVDSSIGEVDAILETFGALLRIAQIESRALTAEFVAIDVSELLQTVLEVYQPIAEEKRQQVATDIAPDLAIMGNRELLGQMFANLIENAMRHTPEGAAISLRGGWQSGGIEIVLADNGPGIPASERRNVFRRFYRLEASRTTPGNGLGLSLVAAVAALHEATIELSDNRPGLRVALRFPAHASLPGASARFAPPARPEPEVSPSLS